MMDVEAKKICDELFDRFIKNNPGSGMTQYLYTLDYRVEAKLAELSNEVDRQRRELDVAKVAVETWKQSYLEQVRDNVKFQARMMAAGEIT